MPSIESQSKDDNEESPQRRRCKECKQKESIYQCPQCETRTCSLECVMRHKKRTGCTGKRNRGAFLPVCRMTDSSLRSDYFFLEEVLDRIPRDSKRQKVDIRSKKNNRKARKILEQSKKRNILLQVMPAVMERHKTNTSWYCAPRDMITWKVELIIHPNLQTLYFQLSENEVSMITHVRNQCDKVGIKLEGLFRLYLKQLPAPARNPRYFEMHESDNLKTFLSDKTIIEHPTIYCVPEKSMEEFPIGSDKISEISVNETMEEPFESAHTTMQT